MYNDKGEAMDREAYVRSHPIRAKILALHEGDEGRSLAAVALLRDLDATQVTAAVVDYHARVLRDAGLLPRADN
jgi:DNA-binding transcriptional ArsR family regulator